MTGIELVFVLLITPASIDFSDVAHLTCNLPDFSDEKRAEFESVVIEGFYSHGFEKKSFRPIDSKKSWWVSSRKLKELLEASGASRLRVEVRGMLSPVGRYGHGLDYVRCLTQVDVLKVIDLDDSKCDETAGLDRTRTDFRVSTFLKDLDPFLIETANHRFTQ